MCDDERRQRAGRDDRERRAGPSALLAETLAPRKAEGGVAGDKGGVELGALPGQVSDEAALPDAAIGLDEIGEDDELDPQPVRYELGRLPRSSKGGSPDPGEPRIPQPVSERFGLGDAGRAQRRIAPTEDPPSGVLVSLTVPSQIQAMAGYLPVSGAAHSPRSARSRSRESAEPSCLHVNRRAKFRPTGLLGEGENT